ncbi:2-succinyl-6-hydroxy-2,4-cyclohexadiene-1-carboxylate synthase [Virgibacillus salinus]|uniref:Putative 2-succinyl-6-hydroxy-2,4-cyclohexadiene-1-carboxylate synthase n=1 Tax=Virgibacillus salinus TaxID=553311 RepID=A0A1H0ZQ94_9BACI|nr:2-succinyl-6-hydroxy-2,4-cyclohexadiene-1-carboxylate synthase [Virgibacillus salinus]SDQ29563.1 2-succinyl-6-hydroxy-2,4-cyclohexadiene-1-carboxylate synthase [Virgibacillus salinus]
MYFKVNDASYWYKIDGEDEGEDTIVFLHGFTGTAATWTSFINDWQDYYQILTIDLPGHGKTTLDTPRTMEECCSDLVHLFDYLKLEKVHLAGYSMGGRTALSVAMLYPERIKSLMLESASPGLISDNDRKSRLNHDEKLASRVEQNGVESFVEFWESIPLFKTQKSLPINIQKQIRDERLSQSADGLAYSLRYMGTGRQPSWWGQLQDITIPVLLLAGAYDQKFIDINKSMSERITSSKLVIVENAGHAIHVEQPGIFGRIVNEFYNSIQ